MTHSAPFASLIQRVQKIPKNLSSDVTFVSVELKTGRSVVNKQPFSFGFSQYRHYLITSDGGSNSMVSGSSQAININHFKKNKSVTVFFDFRMYCQAGKEVLLAKALSQEETPERSFYQLLHKTAQEFIKEKSESEILAHFHVAREEFSAFVASRLSTITGLQIDIVLRLEHESDIKPILLEKTPVQVTLRDDTDLHTLSIEMNAVAKPDQLIDAVTSLAHEPHIIEQITQLLDNYFKNHITYHEFFNNLSQEHRTEIQQQIDRLLNRYGRQLNRWELTRELDIGIKEHINSKPFLIERKPFEATETVTLVNELQLHLVNAGIFKSASKRYHIADLNTWIKEKLEQIIEEVAFEKRYLDYLLNFEPIERDIRLRMTEAVACIGYRLKHLISRPDMKEEVYLKSDNYTFKYDDLPTASSDVTVSFEVAVNFFIPDLHDISNWLNRNLDLRASIETSIRTTLESLLHSQSPDRIYLYLKSPLKNGVPAPDGESSLERRLAESVRQVLINDYCAEVVGTPVIKPLATEIGNFVESLIDKTHDFSVTLRCLKGTSSYQFYGKFTITCVANNGWMRIKNCDFTVKDVCDFFTDSVKTILESLPDESLLEYSSPQAQQEMQRIANTILVQQVTERYGVVASINNFRREQSAIERKASETREKHAFHRLKHVDNQIEERHLNLESSNRIQEKLRKANENELNALTERKLAYLKNDDLESTDLFNEVKQIIEQCYETDETADPDDLNQQIEQAQEIAKVSTQGIQRIPNLTQALLSNEGTEKDREVAVDTESAP